MLKRILKLIENKHFFPILILVIFIIIRIFPIIFSNKTFFVGDNYSLMVPGKIFTSNWLQKGVLPLWNPNLFAGIPWIGDINQSVLYPSTLLFILFNPAIALNLTIFLHLLLTAISMYFLTYYLLKNRKASIISTLIWMFSLQVSHSININISTFQSLSWLPLITLNALKISIHKKHFFYTLILLIIQFLAGYPQHIIFSILISFTLSLKNNFKISKKLIFAWLKLGALFILGSSFIWLPFLDNLFNSTRVLQNQNQASVGSLKFVETIKIVLPYFFENPTHGIRWGISWNHQSNLFVYFTWFGLFLLIYYFLKVKKNFLDKILVTLFLFSLFISFGENIPFYSFFQKIIPILKFTRGPSINLILVVFIGAILIAKSFMKIKLNHKFIKKLLIIFITISLSSIILYFLINFNFDNYWNFLDQKISYKLSSSIFHTPERDYLIFKSIFENFIINILLFSICLLLLSKNLKKLILIIIGIEMLYNTQSLFFFAPNNIYKTPNINFDFNNNSRILTRNYNFPYTDFGAYWDALYTRKPFSDSYINEEELKNFNHLKRMQNGITPNWNETLNIPIIHGYTTLLPKDFNTIWNPENIVSINDLEEIDINNPKLRDWSVGYYLVDNWFNVKEDLSYFPIISQNKNLTLYQIPDALPRFRFTDNSQIDLKNFKENPNKIELSFENLQNQESIIIADRYDKNWQAKINNKKANIENFNGMRKINIQNGENQITLKYIPKEFYLGLIISSLTFLWIFIAKFKGKL